MKKEVTNIHLSPSGSTQVAIGCDYDGARYHVWLDREKLLAGIIDPVVGSSFGIGRRASDNGQATLYKNPPIDVKRGTPEDYKTRYLALDGAIGRKLWPAMRMAVKRDELVAKMLADEKAKADAERAASIEHCKRYAAEQAGPELLATLQNVESIIAASSCAEQLVDCRNLIRSVIAKATTLPEHLR